MNQTRVVIGYIFCKIYILLVRYHVPRITIEELIEIPDVKILHRGYLWTGNQTPFAVAKRVDVGGPLTLSGMHSARYANNCKEQLHPIVIHTVEVLRCMRMKYQL